MFSELGKKSIDELSKNPSRSVLKNWIEQLSQRASDLQKSDKVCCDVVDTKKPCGKCTDFHLDMCLLMSLMEIYARNK